MKTLYHGTSSVNLDCIKAIGLVPGRSHGGDAWASEHHWGLAAKSAQRTPSVFLSDYIAHAEDFARLAVDEVGGDPVVIALHIPADVLATFVPDELSVQHGQVHEWRAPRVDSAYVGEVRPVAPNHGHNLEVQGDLVRLLEALR